MTLFRRHIASTVFLAGYALWWGFLLSFFTSGNAAYPNSCGAANAGLVVLTLLLTLSYCLIWVVLLVVKGKVYRRDYSIFLLLTLAPGAAVLVYGFLSYSFAAQ